MLANPALIVQLHKDRLAGGYTSIEVATTLLAVCLIFCDLGSTIFTDARHLFHIFWLYRRPVSENLEGKGLVFLLLYC